MPVELDQLLNTFLDEAGEHLAALEGGLLKVGRGAADPDLLNAVFRAAHSIKGGSGVFGFDAVTRLTHALEQLLDRLRKGQLPVTRERVDLLLRAVDGLGGLIAAARDGSADAAVVPDELLAALNVAAGAPASSAPPPPSAAPAPPAGPRVYEVRITPGPRLLTDGTDPFLLLRNLNKRGEFLNVETDLGAVPDLDELVPERCYLSWCVRVRSDKGPDALAGVFQFVADDCAVEVTTPAAADPAVAALVEYERAYSRLVDWLVAAAAPA